MAEGTYDDGFTAGSLAAANLILTALQANNFEKAAHFVHANWEAGTLARYTTPAPPSMSREQAKLSGYTGDQCTVCNSLQMRNNGTCLVCESCGQTTGCS